MKCTLARAPNDKWNHARHLVIVITTQYKSSLLFVTSPGVCKLSGPCKSVCNLSAARCVGLAFLQQSALCSMLRVMGHMWRALARMPTDRPRPFSTPAVCFVRAIVARPRA